MTNYELLRLLVETPSRYVEHCRMAVNCPAKMISTYIKILVVGQTTKHMTHSRSWDVEIGRPSVEHVTLGLRRRVTCSTSGRHISMSPSLLSVIG